MLHFRANPSEPSSGLLLPIPLFCIAWAVKQASRSPPALSPRHETRGSNSRNDVYCHVRVHAERLLHICVVSAI